MHLFVWERSLNHKFGHQVSFEHRIQSRDVTYLCGTMGFCHFMYLTAREKYRETEKEFSLFSSSYYEFISHWWRHRIIYTEIIWFDLLLFDVAIAIATAIAAQLINLPIKTLKLCA